MGSAPSAIAVAKFRTDGTHLLHHAPIPNRLDGLTVRQHLTPIVSPSQPFLDSEYALWRRIASLLSIECTRAPFRQLGS